MWPVLLAAILLIPSTAGHAEPHSWDDPTLARAEELATRASERFDEVVRAHRMIEIRETIGLTKPVPVADVVAIGRAMVLGGADTAPMIPQQTGGGALTPAPP